MHHYRHFDNELNLNNTSSSAILSEIDPEDPYHVEISPEIHNYFSHVNKFKLFISQRTRLERYLFISIIFLLIILSITIISFVTYHKKYSINSFCSTSSCIEVSHLISSAMNKSANPCDDFYEFACGRWIQTNIIPKGYSAWSITKELAQKNRILLRNILEKTSISSISYAEQQAVKFYQSCMNTSEIERLKIQPLEDFFKNELNFTLKEWINIDKNQTWQGLFISLTKVISNKYPLSYVLPVKIEADEKNSTWNNIHFDQPKFVLESRDYYINSTTNDQSNARNQIIRDTYIKVGCELLHALGFDHDDAISRMNHIVQFETELATVSLPMEVLQKPGETYHLMSLKQLQELYQPIQLDINSFFNNMLNINSSNPIQFTENDQIIVLSSDLMSKVANILTNYLLTSEKSHIVIDHLLFSLVADLHLYLSSDIEKIMLPLKKELYGTDSIPERWEYCVKQTDSSFGFGLGALYVKTVFGEDDRTKANKLIGYIQNMFGENLNSLQWIDQQTKTEAKIKLDKINQKIGYPDFITNQTKLNQYYDGYPMVESEYFNNQIKVFSRERRRTLLKFRQKVDKTEWHMTPSTVNAYYSPSVNNIVFPAGILQPPFFHKDLPLSINHGAIGVVIGHEITHGFDNQGREFDGDGNMRSWWTKLSLENFQEKTKCFIKQYSNYSLDGQRTLGENIADNGGMKLSYLAYQKHRQETSNSNSDLRLPGLDYDNNQLFFIAFAHSWCNIATPNAMQYNIINDPHSLARFRVIGTVRNSDDFSKAFSCKSKTRDKCELW